MCGIIGIYNSNSPELDCRSASAMAGAIARRGPDAQGIRQLGNTVFAHRRLAIIDLDCQANQPMLDPSSQIMITFNGEIYNYRQLRNKLQQQVISTRLAANNLKAYLDALFVGLDISSMGEEKHYLSLIYAREINAIESNVKLLNDNSYGFNIGETKTYKPNGKTFTYEDLNRLESAILRLYEMAQVHKDNLPHLAITLGQKGLQV